MNYLNVVYRSTVNDNKSKKIMNSSITKSSNITKISYWSLFLDSLTEHNVRRLDWIYPGNSTIVRFYLFFISSLFFRSQESYDNRSFIMHSKSLNSEYGASRHVYRIRLKNNNGRTVILQFMDSESIDEMDDRIQGIFGIKRN
jgi:hypothetical protein